MAKLGKGLSALISEKHGDMDIAQFVNEQDNHGSLNDIALSKLQAGKYQPRQEFDEDALQELADSIKKNGVVQPILVRPKGENYEIIAGERRFRAAKLAGLKTVPVLVMEMDDQHALEIAIVENVQRQNLTVIEEANGYQRLIDEFGYTQEELSETIGKGRSQIANMVRLLHLPKTIHQKLDEGILTMGHAKLLFASEDPEDFAREIIQRSLNVRQAEAILKRKTARTFTKKASRRQKSESAEFVADIVANTIGMKVNITPKNKGGKMVIHYKSADELNQIIKLLKQEA